MDASLEQFLQPYGQDVRDLVVRARALILEVLPDATETRDRADLGYGDGTGYKGLVFVLTPTRSGARLGIADAAGLPDPDGLLQGTGRRHRHVKLASAADVERPALRALLEAAVAAKRSTRPG
jgi:hypothetical protein